MSVLCKDSTRSIHLYYTYYERSYVIKRTLHMVGLAISGFCRSQIEYMSKITNFAHGRLYSHGYLKSLVKMFSEPL